jgi:hypothetical protein
MESNSSCPFPNILLYFNIMIEVIFLGTGAAAPINERNLSGTAVAFIPKTCSARRGRA